MRIHTVINYYHTNSHCSDCNTVTVYHTQARTAYSLYTIFSSEYITRVSIEKYQTPLSGLF